MNTQQNSQMNELSIDQVTSDVSLERLQLYTSHLEGIILKRNSETNWLNSIMESKIRKVQQKMVEYEQIMIHQARLAALGETLGIVAHRWRQPLNAISLSVQNMQDAWEFGEVDDELLNRTTLRITEQVQLLSRAMDDCRNYINPDVNAEYFNPVERVKVLVPLFSKVFSDFTSIRIKVPDAITDDIIVLGSQDAFQLVIHNLLSNANDAALVQKCRVGASFRGEITISFHQAENYIVIHVSDNGGGINESIGDQIFDPCFTTKSKNSGFGIGLYLSKIIIENNMNGSLWFENIPGGARFSIRLLVHRVETGAK